MQLELKETDSGKVLHMNRILAINPGSTSTKVGIYEEELLVFQRTVTHSEGEISQFPELFDQMDFRCAVVKKVLEKTGITPETVTAIAARGGLLPPVKAGAYLVTPVMMDYLRNRPQLIHASNLGAEIAYRLGAPYNIPCYVYDPVTVDEMLPVYKITGLAEFERRALGHNLNMRAMAYRYAREQQMSYSDLTLIVAHLGAGITLTLHDKGRMIDMINDEEGPFSPERTGGLPAGMLIDFALSGKHTHTELHKILKTGGGLKSHLGTKDAREVEKRIEAGDEKAKLVYEAMALAVARWIGVLAVDVKGEVDAIILTGGIAYSKYLTSLIRDHVSFLAPVVIYEGEDELNALAGGILRVLRGEEEAYILSEDELK